MARLISRALDFSQLSGGAFDYDGDGRLDIYLLTNGGPKSDSINRLVVGVGEALRDVDDLVRRRLLDPPHAIAVARRVADEGLVVRLVGAAVALGSIDLF